MLATASILGSVIVGVPAGFEARAAILPTTATTSSNGLTLGLTAFADHVEIDADSVDPNAILEISKDGTFVDSVIGSGHVIDKDVTQGQNFTYTLEVSSIATKAEAIDAGINATVVKDSKVLGSYVNFSMAAATVGVPYADFVNAFGVAQPASAATVDKTRFRYQTFIPTATTPSKMCFPVYYIDPRATAYLFKGDNRSFDHSPATSKTRHDVIADWNSGGNLTGTPGVGWSHLLVYSNSTLLSDNTLRATTDNMSMTVSYESSTASAFHLHNDTQNPFCGLSNGIFYDIDVVLHRNGTYSVSGVALNAPNHEIWLQDVGTGVWSPVMFKTGNMDCLTPGLSGIIPGCNVTVASSGVF